MEESFQHRQDADAEQVNQLQTHPLTASVGGNSMPPPAFQLSAGPTEAAEPTSTGPVLPETGSGFASIVPPASPGGSTIQAKFTEYTDAGSGATMYRDEDTGDTYEFHAHHPMGYVLKNSQFIVVINSSGDLVEKHPNHEMQLDESVDTGSSTGTGDLATLDQSTSADTLYYPLETGMDNLRETGINPTKLTTELTSQISMIPVAQGELGPATAGFAEFKYAAGQIWVTQIQLGDKDRPETRFDNQESHTVAWTLVRSGLMGLANQSLEHFIMYLAEEFKEMEPLVKTLEAKSMMAVVSGLSIIQTMLQGTLPIDRWQQLTSNLLVHYLQVYQLSSSSTYKRGKANGHGEYHARTRLERDELNASQGNPTRATGKIALDCAKLLDVQFRVDSLGVQEYATAVGHWTKMLQSAFPHLMHNYQDQISKPVYGKQLAKSFKEELGIPRTQSVTVKDLLAKYDIVMATTPKPAEERTLEQVDLLRSSLGRLGTNFVANIGVAPHTQGQRGARRISDTVTIEDMAYSYAHLSVSDVQVSDYDRPKTKFIKDQKSHTVPWTLARNHIISFQGKSIQALMEYLFGRFQELALEIKIDEGKKIAQDGIALIKANSSKMLPIDEWQRIVSELVRKYFIAYQAAESTTYVNPEEAERALGHGEASNMAVLRRNEHTIENHDGTLDDEPRILKAIKGMFDAEYTSTLSEAGIKQAFLGMQHKLKATFPLVSKHFLDKAVTQMSAEKKGFGLRTLGEIVADDSIAVDRSGFESLAVHDPFTEANYVFSAADLVDATGTIQPHHMDTFRAAYRQDVAASSAYLTEAEGNLAAQHLGITVQVYEGDLPAGWARVENPGSGHCLLHALVQARAAANGLAIPAGATSGEIAALRTYIGGNLGNDIIDPLIVAAVVGRIMGVPEPGLGANMRGLLVHPSITVAAQIESGKSSTSTSKGSSSSSSSGKEVKKKDHGGMDLDVAIATFGSGVALPGIALLHTGAHYVMIRRTS